ncbi:unnamed protein product [Lactuca saligna]|uniref:DUF4216 domain-containing protein n=1 Tax=Lactuca saligna TaxID=75948 RepID=A0AA36DY26_LACSI|nr:unnamed protein product [Lactuca saligna]
MVTRDSTDGSAKHLEPLANGPSKDARSYNGYFVNGYKFHTQEYGKGRATNNYGLCMRGEMYNGKESKYYVNKNKLVDVNPKSRIQTNDPFCLASQAEQVFYTPYPAVTKETKDLWAVVKTKPRGVYEVTKAEMEVALDGNTEANGFFHLDERFELPNEVNVSERLTLDSNRTNFKQISSDESEGSDAENLEDDTYEKDRDEPVYFDYSDPDEDECGFVPGARSSPLSDLSDLPCNGFVSGARSSPSPNGLPRIPLSSGLSRTSVRTATPRFSGSSIVYGYEMTGNNEEPANDFFYNGPGQEHEPEHRHESVHEPESLMIQTPHYSGTQGGSNDAYSNGSRRPFITRKGYK